MKIELVIQLTAAILPPGKRVVRYERDFLVCTFIFIFQGIPSDIIKSIKDRQQQFL
jgi:hypothetical protein